MSNKTLFDEKTGRFNSNLHQTIYPSNSLSTPQSLSVLSELSKENILVDIEAEPRFKLFSVTELQSSVIWVSDEAAS